MNIENRIRRYAKLGFLALGLAACENAPFPNQPPVVTVTQPALDTTRALTGTNIPLQADAVSLQHSKVKLEMFVNGSLYLPGILQERPVINSSYLVPQDTSRMVLLGTDENLRQDSVVRIVIGFQAPQSTIAITPNPVITTDSSLGPRQTIPCGATSGTGLAVPSSYRLVGGAPGRAIDTTSANPIAAIRRAPVGAWSYTCETDFMNMKVFATDTARVNLAVAPTIQTNGLYGFVGPKVPIRANSVNGSYPAQLDSITLDGTRIAQNTTAFSLDTVLARGNHSLNLYASDIYANRTVANRTLRVGMPFRVNIAISDTIPLVGQQITTTTTLVDPDNMFSLTPANSDTLYIDRGDPSMSLLSHVIRNPTDTIIDRFAYDAAGIKKIFGTFTYLSADGRRIEVPNRQQNVHVH